MRILFLCHAFNSLTQRLYVELLQLNHDVSVEFDINDSVAKEAVDLYKPELIIAPFLKRAIHEDIWRHHCCFIVHPGIIGDRGPSAIDWAIINNKQDWGVTVLQANAEMDAGDIWADSRFKMRNASKASLYHNEITEAAVEAVLVAVERFQKKEYVPLSQGDKKNDVPGQLQPLMKQSDRKINWLEDDTEMVLRKIRSADGFPGVLDTICGREVFLYDAHKETQLTGKPGEIIYQEGNAICRATVDGAVWIGYLRDKSSGLPFKLPATTVLKNELRKLPVVTQREASGCSDIWYEEDSEIGYLHFPFYNGAMSTEQCKRLKQAYISATKQATKIIVLMGGNDYWSNGMHLNLIEASESAADESWNNINAIDDLALEIITTKSHLTVSAIQGNAGAGGVFLARAADRVWARKGIVLNPHYKDMGNLYGSEYWTYLLPRYVGEKNVKKITQSRLPLGTSEALSLGLIDATFADNIADFKLELKLRLETLLTTDIAALLKEKQNQRTLDEKLYPLSEYREKELEKMHLNFYGFDPSYHVARYNFIYKVPKSRTPLTIAKHRRVSEVLST